jgi:aminopeptidase N
MTDASSQTIYLADYTPPAYLIDTVHLTFDLSPDATRVTSKISFRPNPDSAEVRFFLHGVGLKLIWAKIDGVPITPDLITDGLTCPVPDTPCVGNLR